MVNSISLGTCWNGLVVSHLDAEQKVLLELPKTTFPRFLLDT